MSNTTLMSMVNIIKHISRNQVYEESKIPLREKTLSNNELNDIVVDAIYNKSTDKMYKIYLNDILYPASFSKLELPDLLNENEMALSGCVDGSILTIEFKSEKIHIEISYTKSIINGKTTWTNTKRTNIEKFNELKLKYQQDGYLTFKDMRLVAQSLINLPAKESNIYFDKAIDYIKSAKDAN